MKNKAKLAAAVGLVILGMVAYRIIWEKHQQRKPNGKRKHQDQSIWN